MVEEGRVSISRQIRALATVALYQPGLTARVVLFNVVAAALEGVGIGFILPVIEVAQSTGEASGPVRVLAGLYDSLGVPFTLEYIIAGVALVIGIRYIATFLSGWLTAVLRMTYIRSLRTRAFESTLHADTNYFDSTGTDTVLNTLITQTNHASEAIHRSVVLLKNTLVSAAYILVALYVAPVLMLVTGAVLGVFMLSVRHIFESGYSIGERVADANEHLQETIQSGVQGIREIKLLGITGHQFSAYQTAVDEYTASMIHRRRNQVAINSLNYFATAVFVFLLLYVGLEILGLSLGGLGVFLFAMFRLGPRLSLMNTLLYELETDLPHLVRTQEFVTSVETNQEQAMGKPVDGSIDSVEFDGVSFAYDAGEQPVLEDVSFSLTRGEFVAFAGRSGAGKSTIIALLARLYEPTAGEIRADDTPIWEFDLDSWRERIAVVRQDPHMFNDTLRFNVAIGDLDATDEEIERVCEIAQATEFIDDLPEGYETVLGDDGVRLSGGQRQRIAIARALLEDADILLLDEATSDLDSSLEEAVYDSLADTNREHAVLTITHRLSTVTEATRIHILEDGRIVESGTDESLRGAGGTYSELLGTHQLSTPN